MMQILIDNKDIKTVYGIDVLDYTGLFNFASERDNARVWNDKSGVDKNLVNRRFDANEVMITCSCKASTVSAAYALINTLVEYMCAKGVFIVSLRDTALGIRECFACERSTSIVGSINVRQQNSLYVFKLGLRDINPNAVKYKATIVEHPTTHVMSTSVAYTKGQSAVIFWGNGDKGKVSNSGTYAKADYLAPGPVDIIVDIDKTEPNITALEAIFSADITSGVYPDIVQFTDASTGDIRVWNWDFGDGSASSEQSPSHQYMPGTYTVTLQIFNTTNGYDIEEKVNYITIRASRIMINDTDILLSGTTNKLLINP